MLQLDSIIVGKTLAVRHDWAANTPLHLGQFFAVQLGVTLKAYHGEGDHAPDASQTQVHKEGERARLTIDEALVTQAVKPALETTR